MPRRRTTALPRPALALTLALTLAGCGTSGYGTVDTHQLVLIPTATPGAAALACGARAEADRLHRALKVERPRNDSPSAQIAVTNAVTATKPGGVLIVPVNRNAMLAPILSMQRAGIRVVRLPAAQTPGTAAAMGARAVATAVREMERRNRDAPGSEAVTVPDRCGSVQ